MYHGLVKLVLVDPSSGAAVFDFLLPHFLQFFKEVNADPCDFLFFLKLYAEVLIHYGAKLVVYHVKCHGKKLKYCCLCIWHVVDTLN